MALVIMDLRWDTSVEAVEFPIDREQIQQACSNQECGKTSFYTRTDFRGHHDPKSNLYLEGGTAVE